MKKISYLILFISFTFCQNVPMLINYQAKLVDDSNNPITGTVSVTFRLYDAIDNGTLKWSESHSSIQSNDGLISVLLGSLSNFNNSIFVNAFLFLETEVDGFGILSPRQQLTAVPYAIKASNTLDLMHFSDQQVHPPSELWNGTPYTVFDTTFVLTKTEYLIIETLMWDAYNHGGSLLIYFGLVGSESQVGAHNGGDQVMSQSSNQYNNYYPNHNTTIPINNELVGQSVRLYIDASTGGSVIGGLNGLRIWGK